jgi:hypothetical protein
MGSYVDLCVSFRRHPTCRTHQSHLPSFHPVRHRSSHRPQSKVGFPSFMFTSLCASQSHCPKSCRELSRGAFLSDFIHIWKSVAQDQHGYRFEKVRINCFAFTCSSFDGVTGYCAAMECRSIQDARPSWSTSGGQPDGGSKGVLEVSDRDGRVRFFVNAAHAAKDVHERHLRYLSNL